MLLKVTVLIACICLLAKGQTPAFEVAWVKASPPSDRPVLRTSGGPGTSSPGQITYTNLTMRMLITKAWDLKPYQIAGPDTLDGPRFDITAKVSAGTSVADFQMMLQRLLAERIGLVVHHESKEMPVFEMVIAKGGLKMKEAEPAPEMEPPAANSSVLQTDQDGFTILRPGRPGAVISGLFGVFKISARMQGLTELLRTMEQYSGRPVIDKSGITGKYDYHLAFARDSVPESKTPGRPALVAAGLAPAPVVNDAPRTPTPVEPAPTFRDAIVKQLGLQLEPAKASIDVLHVDRFNKEPTQN